jgi:hypothetical protein
VSFSARNGSATSGDIIPAMLNAECIACIYGPDLYFHITVTSAVAAIKKDKYLIDYNITKRKKCMFIYSLG